MELIGHVRNGGVVLDGPPVLPEGAEVSVSLRASAPPPPTGRRVQVPLVRTGAPGTLHLTDERIAEFFDADDLAAARHQRLVGVDV